MACLDLVACPGGASWCGTRCGVFRESASLNAAEASRRAIGAFGPPAFALLCDKCCFAGIGRQRAKRDAAICRLWARASGSWHVSDKLKAAPPQTDRNPGRLCRTPGDRVGRHSSPDYSHALQRKAAALLARHGSRKLLPRRYARVHHVKPQERTAPTGGVDARRWGGRLGGRT